MRYHLFVDENLEIPFKWISVIYCYKTNTGTSCFAASVGLKNVVMSDCLVFCESQTYKDIHNIKFELEKK